MKPGATPADASVLADASSASRCHVLLAGPGFGKTAIVAKYAAMHDRGRHILALPLCVYMHLYSY